METPSGEIPKQPLSETQIVLEKIKIRANKALANPSLYQDQIDEINLLANLTGYALSIGNPLSVDFAKEFIELTDPLIASGEDK